MSQYKKLGKEQEITEELFSIFRPFEGSVNMYYGRIGSGKSYSATSDVLELLEKGQVVYVNWPINWEGYDQREHFWPSLFNFIFFKKSFYNFPKDNLKFFRTEDVTIEFLSALKDCHVFIDEGQWLLDSRSRLNKDWRKLILHTRHANRTLNIISQRTNAIEVSARGQVNVFYKCEKKLTWPWLILRRYEYQDMKNDDVDDGETAEPISIKTYFARKKVMNAYNTHYLREGEDFSKDLKVDIYRLDFFERTMAVLLNFVGYKGKKKPEPSTLPPALEPEALKRLEVKWDGQDFEMSPEVIFTDLSYVDSIKDV